MKILKSSILLIILLVITGGLIVLGKNNFSISDQQTNNSQNLNKEYLVTEGKVTVLERQSKKEINAIDLSAKEEDFLIKFYPHDIAGVNDKKQVWVTASASQEEIQSMSKELVEKTKQDQHVMMATDQVIVIDTATDKIVKRIPIGVSLGLADIIIAPDNRNAYVTVEANAVYKVNMDTHKVELIQLPPESKPHQLALSADGTKLYTRNQANNNVFLISKKTNEVEKQENMDETKNLKWSSH
jgi:DNA-binding beta-propeller fold protein YncE